MIFGTDTWYLLSVWDGDAQSTSLLRRIREEKGGIFIPVAAFSEATRKLMQRGVSDVKINEFWERFTASDKIRFLPLDKEIAKEAARISISYGIPLVDSFIAATVKLSGCDVLLSADEDMAVLARKKYIKVQSW